MASDYMTLDEHIELLNEKGYLDSNFKTATQAGYWLREFHQQYEQCRTIAKLEGKQRPFTMQTYGKFNNDLDTVAITFYYLYEPLNEKITLRTVHSKLGKAFKPYYPPRNMDLPPAAQVYESLSRPAAEENNVSMYIRLWYEFENQRNRDNDYDPEAKNSPLDIKDEPKRPAPPKLGLPPKFRR